MSWQTEMEWIGTYYTFVMEEYVVLIKCRVQNTIFSLKDLMFSRKVYTSVSFELKI